MNKLRAKIFRSAKTPPALENLPPTDLCLEQHLLRAHAQIILWEAALDKMPPNLDISEFGWYKHDDEWLPKTGIKDIAPPELSKVIACTL